MTVLETTENSEWHGPRVKERTNNARLTFSVREQVTTMARDMGVNKFLAAAVWAGLWLSLTGCASITHPFPAEADNTCQVEFIVLGTGQDAGAPQIGHPEDPAWGDGALGLTATSAALVDHRAGARYLFEASPDIGAQLNQLDALAPMQTGALGLSGVFITHAHIGHYAGLMYFGREAAGARDLNVYAMPRLASFLEQNGPWEQLVSLGNISIQRTANHAATMLGAGLSVTPHRVPHRDEYSETVGFVIQSADKSILFLPDIDSWDEWRDEFDTRIEDMIAAVDVAYLDATFFSDTELPGRDMSSIPHPRVSGSMDRFDALAPDQKRKVRFIHINHTNPIRFARSPQAISVSQRGYGIAKAGERVCLVTGSS